MTTAAATRIYSIPASGLRHESGTKTWTLAAVGCGGWSLNVRVDGVKTDGDYFTFSTNALNAWNAIVDANPAVVETAVVRLQPAASGHISPAQFEIIGQALESAGTIRRGRGHAKADIRQLYAMRDARFVTLDHDIRARVGTVTAKGRKRYAEIAAEHAEAAERAAAIAHVLAYAAA